MQCEDIVEREIYILFYYYWDEYTEIFFPSYKGCFNSIEEILINISEDSPHIISKLEDLYPDLFCTKIFTPKVFMPKENPRLCDISDLYFYAKIIKDKLRVNSD